MKDEDRIRTLRMAVSCLRRRGDERPIFSKTVPTNKELEEIKQSLSTGIVSDELLKKFFPMAYKGVSVYGFHKYFFQIHNQLVRMLKKYADNGLSEWCTAMPGIVVSVNRGEYVVRTINNKEITTDSTAYPRIMLVENLRVGDRVVVHRGKIHMVLNKEEYNTVLSLFA